MKTKDFIQQDWVKKEIINRLNYNPVTGSLTWSGNPRPYLNRNIIGKEAGYSRVVNGYTYNRLTLKINKRQINIPVGRICWLVHTGDWPKHTIDHIDRNPLNNKWENLRDVTQKENNSNKGFYKGRVFKYVVFRRGFWEVNFNGKYLGGSVCLGKAVKKRDEMLKDHFVG